MYKLSLNNEEFFELRTLLETTKRQFNNSWGWSETLDQLMTKVTLSQIEANDEAERERQGSRYAMNLHSMPEGS